MNKAIKLYSVALRAAVLPLFLVAFFVPFANGMTVSGNVVASSVVVTGDVTMSSMTVSSVTVTDFLQATDAVVNSRGIISQMKSSSTVNSFSTTSTAYVAVPLSSSITLTNPSSYVRISLTGILSISNPNLGNAYLTIKRDSVDLGNTDDGSGLAMATSNLTGGPSVYVPVGITAVDFPGDTISHTYQVFIRSDTSSVNAVFSVNGLSCLVVEEIYL